MIAFLPATVLALSLPALPALSNLPPAVNSVTATVNDARSHGAVGDQFLSLDEAIRLAGGTLVMTQLSMAEMAQITGAGMVDCIVVDPMMTPTITLEGPLSDVMMMGGGMSMLTITGMAGGMGMAMPVLDGGTHVRVLTLRTHMARVMGLQIRGGQVALDVRTTAGSMMPGGMAMVMDCMFDGQTTAGIKGHAGGTGETTAFMAMRSMFRNAPVGILLDDQSNQGGLMFEGEHLDFDGVSLGVDIVGNGRQNVSMNMLFRSKFRNGDGFVRFVRGTASSQQHMIRIVHCDAIATGHCLDVRGTNAGLTMVHHHHSNLEAGPGNQAFRAVPRTALFDLHGSENTFTGGVTLSGNLFTQRIWQQSNTYRGGTLVLDNDGAQPNLLWNRFEGSAVAVLGSARTPSQFRSCEFSGASIVGSSALGGVTLSGCFRNGTATVGWVTDNNPAPAPFLGGSSVVPTDPQIGATVTLNADLPYGIGAIWHVAMAVPRPNVSAEPYRLYGDPATVIVLPGMVVFQSQITVPIPNNPGLIGLEFYAQAAAIPLLGQSYAPVVHLPRGGLIRPRM